MELLSVQSVKNNHNSYRASTANINSVHFHLPLSIILTAALVPRLHIFIILSVERTANNSKNQPDSQCVVNCNKAQPQSISLDLPESKLAKVTYFQDLYNLISLACNIYLLLKY
ncbi:unnamed protein product [Heterobilharzia americana]|nr:unnamed protein product [Heterobilharzia americana]